MSGYSWSDMRRQQAARKAEEKTAQTAYLNRGTSQESSLAKFQALYDPDPKLMKGNSVDVTILDLQQWNAETYRAGEAFVAALKSAGHELSDAGLRKFVEYVNHHHVGNMVLDIRRVDVLAAAFNRASDIGLFQPSDFKSNAAPTSVPRDRDAAERQEYLADLRKELGDEKFRQIYGNQGLSPLGARRPNIQI